MCKLIINADDFGLSEKVNEGILKAHTHGILTSTSIMATGSAFRHAVRLSKSTPSLDVGAHLTLVEETPVLSAKKIPSLINQDGKFYFNASDFMKRYMFGRVNRHEARRELEAQLLKMLDSGLNISHIDSHQHLHMLPKILSEVVELAKKYNIPAIRFPREFVCIKLLKEKWAFKRLMQMLVLNYYCHLGRKLEFVHTDRFMGFLVSGRLNKENLSFLLSSLPEQGTCEIMCHPGEYDKYGKYAHWGYNWSAELKALTHNGFFGLFDRKGIELISFRDLVKDSGSGIGIRN